MDGKTEERKNKEGGKKGICSSLISCIYIFEIEFSMPLLP